MAVATYYGLNSAPAGGVSGEPAVARAAFLAALLGSVSTFGFEAADGISNGASLPIVAGFLNSATGVTTNVTITSTSTKFVPTVRNTASAGRYNTTSGGSQYLQVSAELTAQTLTFTPSRPISGFGFYATDVGDFAGIFSVRLTAVNGDTVTLVVTDQLTLNLLSGNLIFWGFTDDAASYNKVEIIASGPSDTLGQFDYFGFDDFVIAEPSQVIQPVNNFLPGGCQAWPAGLQTR